MNDAAIFATLAVLAFLFPAALAYRRKHHNRAAIFALVVLLGWTGFGWCLALIWSLTAVRRDVS